MIGNLHCHRSPRHPTTVLATVVLTLALHGCASPADEPSPTDGTTVVSSATSASPPPASPPPASPPAGTAQPTPTAQPGNNCAGDPDFPDGADTDPICSPDPAGAKELNAGSLGSAVLFTPSQNIWCSIATDQLDCAMIDPYLRIDLDPEGPAYEPDRDDGPAAEQPVTVEYGDTVTFGAFACHSQELGLACWSKQSGHGLYLSRAHQEMW